MYYSLLTYIYAYGQMLPLFSAFIVITYQSHQLAQSNVFSLIALFVLIGDIFIVIV